VLFQRIAAVVCFNTARLHSKDSAEDAMPCNMSKNIIDFALAPSAMAQCLVRTATRSQSELSIHSQYFRGPQVRASLGPPAASMLLITSSGTGA
jgi:hypothetical protein